MNSLYIVDRKMFDLSVGIIGQTVYSCTIIYRGGVSLTISSKSDVFSKVLLYLLMWKEKMFV